jgi:structural maintenance of chromosome 4
MKPIAQNPNDIGLLEYLEDIIGSNKYVEKIEDLEKSLESKNDEKIEKTNRVKAAHLELSSMEDEKNQAVGYIRKERDYMLLTNMLYLLSLETVSNIIMKASKKSIN